jgi:hypothetical protein
MGAACCRKAANPGKVYVASASKYAASGPGVAGAGQTNPAVSHGGEGKAAAGNVHASGDVGKAGATNLKPGPSAPKPRKDGEIMDLAQVWQVHEV